MKTAIYLIIQLLFSPRTTVSLASSGSERPDFCGWSGWFACRQLQNRWTQIRTLLHSPPSHMKRATRCALRIKVRPVKYGSRELSLSDHSRVDLHTYCADTQTTDIHSVIWDQLLLDLVDLVDQLLWAQIRLMSGHHARTNHFNGPQQTDELRRRFAPVCSVMQNVWSPEKIGSPMPPIVPAGNNSCFFWWVFFIKGCSSVSSAIRLSVAQLVTVIGWPSVG